MNEAEFLEVVNAVCKHPKVYTKHGSFDEVVIFLEGFAMGANVGNKPFHSKLTPFLQWLAEKFEKQESIIQWDELKIMFQDEGNVCGKLAVLYEEYVKNLNSN